MMNERIREKEFKFKDRKYVEKLDKEQLRDRIYKYELEDYDQQYYYDNKKREMYLVMYIYNPPGRILHKYFSYKFNMVPDFKLYSEQKEHFNGQQKLYNLGKVNQMRQKSILMFPNDNSVLRVERNRVGEMERWGVNVRLEEENSMGIKENHYYYQIDGQMRINYYRKEGKVRLDITEKGKVISCNDEGDI